jgi:sulfatase maturation enzyme AslB (radical SAM superfamily)
MYSSLTLYLTERCNYSCAYCYQARGGRTIGLSVLDAALDVFLPRLRPQGEVHFYGGEPLLAFARIRRAVPAAEGQLGPGRTLRFGLTTNGSLLDDGVLGFLRDHRFRVQLSFDGLAQDEGRRAGSFRPLLRLIERLLRSRGLDLETNSVFTPGTVHLLAESLKLIHGLGVADIHLAFSNLEPWPTAALDVLKSQLGAYARFARRRRRETGEIPLDLFRPGRRDDYFVCGAARNRIAVGPDGTVWGCYLFIDHFRGRRRSAEARGYSLGPVERFETDSGSRLSSALERYGRLQMPAFKTAALHCWACPQLAECAICPLEAAAPGGTIGLIPEWTCRIARILRTARARFLSGTRSPAA